MHSKVFSFWGHIKLCNFYNIIRRPIVVEFMGKLFSDNAFMGNFTETLANIPENHALSQTVENGK